MAFSATAARLMMPVGHPETGGAQVVVRVRSRRPACSPRFRPRSQPEDAMGLMSVFAVGFGAFAGALLRWSFGIALNPLLPVLPLGTLAANQHGGLVIGAAIGLFDQFQ